MKLQSDRSSILTVMDNVAMRLLSRRFIVISLAVVCLSFAAPSVAQITFVSPTPMSGQQVVKGTTTSARFTYTGSVSYGILQLIQYGGTVVQSVTGALQNTTYNFSTTSLATGGYYFKIYDASAPSNFAVTPIFSLVAIAAPTGLDVINNTTTTFVLTWNAVPGATSYKVDVSSSMGFTTLDIHNNVTATTNSKIVGGMSQAINVYYARVRTVNSTGTSANSATLTCRLLPVAPVLTPVTNVTENSFTINWNATPFATHYFVDVSNKADFSTYYSAYHDHQVNGTSLSLSYLYAKTNYYFRVRAVNQAGNSAYSEAQPPLNLDRNYIKTVSILKKGVAPNDFAISSLTFGQKMEEFMFVDGLGRPSQRILKNQSPSGNDIVYPIVYNSFGMEDVKYLPYVGGDEGWYKFDFKHKNHPQYASINSPQYTYYQSQEFVANDPNPYAVTVYEKSPLRRVIKQGAAGASWQPDYIPLYTSIDQTSKFDYQFNATSEVLKWTHTPASAASPSSFGLINAGSAASPVTYDPAQLSKLLSKDEQNKEVIEFKDMLGRTVLKKVQAGPSLYADTYYIYDSFDNLMCVLPPEAVSRLATEYYHAGATNATKEAFLKRWTFRYAYDIRNRLVRKQLPGIGQIFMVYDNRDRIVVTQDSVFRSQKIWHFTKYDELNRPVLTGLHTADIVLTQQAMSDRVNTYYTNLGSNNGAWYETYVGASGAAHGYDNKSYPLESNSNNYLTINYYDGYGYRSLWSGSYTYTNLGVNATAHGLVYSQPAIESNVVRGQITGTKIKILEGSNQWLKSTIYYDDQYRQVQIIADNQTGSTNVTTNIFDFTGNVLKSQKTHAVRWRERSGVTVSATSVKKTQTTGWGNAGTASVKALSAGENGYIELIVSETNTARMIGFSKTNENLDYTTMDFTVYLNSTTLYAYERNTNRGSKGTVATGDVIRLDRTGSTVKILKNGTAIYTFPTSSTTALYADCSLNTTGSTLSGLILSWGDETHTTIRRFDYDHARRLTNSWHKINSNPETLISKMDYSDMGLVVDKRLHSTVASAADAKQSVDYRYNIRGWLTRINRSDLTLSGEAGEERDLFGMELIYNNLDPDISNVRQYNGNISAIKWSSNLSLDNNQRENAYTYSYDLMRRLTGSIYKQRGSSSWANFTNNGYTESGITYDLNGNILLLTRKDGRTSGDMDNLEYVYTDQATGVSQGNRLIRVTDGGDKFKGFIDGTNGVGTNDYSYDGNGNMLTDQNKGILESSPILYNHMNLPETINKGTSTIRYVYDASGRKLSQTVYATGVPKQTDYVGEYVYTNGALQYAGHEEGRVVMSTENKLRLFDGSHQNGITKTGADVTLTNETQNGETYLKAVIGAGATKRGISALSGPVTVTEGQRFVFRVRGYRGGEAAALYVKGNTTDVVWPGASLPNNTNIEAWVETYFSIPPGVTQIDIGVMLNSANTVAQNFFINGAELIQLGTNVSPEYQYYLKDHLGNIRVTFTTKDQLETYTAGFEVAQAAAENATFSPSYANAVTSSASVYNHTPSGTTSQRLSAANANEIVGLAKSLSVMPGDTIHLKVFAKYLGPTSSNSGITATSLVASIASAFGLSPASTGEAFKAYSNLSQMFTVNGAMIGPGEWEEDNSPKAYLNYILFDKDFVPYDMGWDQIDVDALENGTDVEHDELELTAPVRKPGYIYIYLSNENGKIVDVYFDDLTITHHFSPVIQVDDYYAFGMNFNSYKRENGIGNTLLYNGKEKQDELDLGWMDYGARMYVPEIGRFFNPDPSCENYFGWTPYNYCANSPVYLVDPFGTDWFYYQAAGEDAAGWHWHEGSTYDLPVGYYSTGQIEYAMLTGEKAVVTFEGSREETLTSSGNIDGEGAVNATVSVYGPDGTDDVHEYAGYTMTSSADDFTPIDEGIYEMKRRASSGSSAIPKNYQVFDDSAPTDEIRTMDGVTNNNAPSQTTANGEGFKNAIFVHRTNNNGYAGMSNNNTSGVSTGCLLIKASDYNGENGFDAVLSGMGNGVSIKLILTRTGATQNPVLNSLEQME
jgi:RHS repeat-associated protein